jgi:hypothetical protein
MPYMQDKDFSVIDWTNVFEVFCQQDDDLFSFLGRVHVEGSTLTEDERTQAFCDILSRQARGRFVIRGLSLFTRSQRVWEYAVVKPPASPGWTTPEGQVMGSTLGC